MHDQAMPPADRRAEFITALRDLADYLTEHPALPVPSHVDINVFPARGTDTEKRAGWTDSPPSPARQSPRTTGTTRPPSRSARLTTRPSLPRARGWPPTVRKPATTAASSRNPVHDRSRRHQAGSHPGPPGQASWPDRLRDLPWPGLPKAGQVCRRPNRGEASAGHEAQGATRHHDRVAAATGPPRVPVARRSTGNDSAFRTRRLVDGCQAGPSPQPCEPAPVAGRRRGTAAPAVWNLPGIPACRDSDPAVFFPLPGSPLSPPGPSAQCKPSASRWPAPTESGSASGAASTWRPRPGR